MSDVIQFPVPEVPNLAGPRRIGSSVIVDGRLVPRLHMHDRGDKIEFVLDDRMAWEFPREMAYNAASFVAQAMAIGAGYSCFSAEKRDHPFAPQCMEITLPEEPAR